MWRLFVLLFLVFISQLLTFLILLCIYLNIFLFFSVSLTFFPWLYLYNIEKKLSDILLFFLMIQNTDLQAFQANITHLAVKGPADEWEGEVGEENRDSGFDYAKCLEFREHRRVTIHKCRLKYEYLLFHSKNGLD